MKLLNWVWPYYKKNGLIATMKKFNRLFRRKLPYREYYMASFVYFLLRGQLLTYSNGFYHLRDLRSNEEWILPGLRATYHTFESYQVRITNQYFDNEYLQIDKDDIVFEVGSYIGGSTHGVADISKHVYAIEASPRNVKCLKDNTRNLNNVTVLHKAAWHKKDNVQINYGAAADDDSLLNPDKGFAQKTAKVPADTISNIAEEVNVDEIDFLKVEAEGVEPEVIKGTSEVHIDKIAVDCGPERNGEPVSDDVSKYLEEMGYNVTIDGKMLYAKKVQ